MMKYIGTELELFAQAINWKRYWASKLRPFVRGKVLDVGCGIGANAPYLLNPAVVAYTFLEPDPELLARVQEHVPSEVAQRSELMNGTSADLTGRLFDTILYVDVIEHIADSRMELARAFQLLAPNGHLLILVPAHQFLYSALDKALGHYRRYDRALLRRELPNGATVVQLFHLDSPGMALSFGNRLFAKQALPSKGQIRFWDRWVVPVARLIDPLIGHRYGRSLVAVVRKPPLRQ